MYRSESVRLGERPPRTVETDRWGKRERERRKWEWGTNLGKLPKSEEIHFYGFNNYIGCVGTN